MTNESEDMMTSKGGTSEDTTSGENTGSGTLKKGPWTSAEDAILVEYVTKHGEGNWNAVQKHSGLARCGKSCRLRWANHLRPDLKKGAFTLEEERRIIELHAKMGNKWARMAAELPGRTDNEIKNYWNTRIKRRQRAGLPIYPPDICLKSLNASKQNEDFNTFSNGATHHPDLFQVNNFEIPAVEFRNLELYLPAFLQIPSSNLLDIPPSNMLAHGLNTSYGNISVLSTIRPSKRIRGSDNSVQIPQSFGFSSVYDQYLASGHPSFSGVIHGSHASLNGNSSSPDPTWAKKMELPSLQSHHMGSWGLPSSHLPSLESVDTLIQSPPAEHNSLSPRNSGLLDAVLYESHTKNNYGDPISPLGHSAESVFSEYTNRINEVQSGGEIKQECDDKNDASKQKMFSRPDFLLDSNCFGHGKNQSFIKDAFGVVLFDDFSRDCKKMGAVANSTGQGCVHDSCAWDAMSTF